MPNKILLPFVFLFSPCCVPASRANKVKHSAQDNAKSTGTHFEISFLKEMSALPIDGHVLLLISTNDEKEPRFQISFETPDSQQVFGADVEALVPGAPATFDASTLGYPALSLRDIPAGDYWIQGLLNIYETFHLANGHTVKLPPDKGEGQHWNVKPGNLFSKQMKGPTPPANAQTIRISLTEKIPAIEDDPKVVDSVVGWDGANDEHEIIDNKWVKHIRIQSELLTKFWGGPTYLEAVLLLPDGWAEHPDAHYPLIVEQDHLHRGLPGIMAFRAESPSPELTGGDLRAAQSGYKLYQDWTAGRLPRVIGLSIQHATPYFDDSYAVNSANQGPYGDAITQELIPYIENKFHGIGQGWARAVYGGSTGGWETLASQVFYPDDYNGAWGACPDPVDFHGYQSVNIYDDKNAYWTIGPFAKVNQPEMRAANGIVEATTEGSNRWELVLGTHGRSGEQWDIWQAVFSPVGKDGYPAEIWNQLTGEINKDVVPYWHDHYDLTAIMQRDWKTLGPKLVGKLHVMVGTADTYYLDHAVHLMQHSLEATTNPHYAADFDYGVDQPHCYTGPPGSTTREGGATFTQRVLKAAEEQMLKPAPASADTKSWRY